MALPNIIKNILGREEQSDQTGVDPENDVSIFTREDGMKNMATCKPEVFQDVKKIADAFKENVPVILLLRKVKSSQHRQRVIDFCYGLVVGLDGAMEQIDTDVYVLTPYDYKSVVDVLSQSNQNDQILD